MQRRAGREEGKKARRWSRGRDKQPDKEKGLAGLAAGAREAGLRGGEWVGFVSLPSLCLSLCM